MNDEVRWILYVRADHRTGTIVALAGVFATRGVNFDALATGESAEGTGLVTVTFVANERRQRLLARSVERLAVVHSVLVRRADDLGCARPRCCSCLRASRSCRRRMRACAGRG
ncbi:MAG: hypothetical protein L6311_13935 [Cellulomonas sp.]|nr:hypothetical protein [Cellulomonas sp.]